MLTRRWRRLALPALVLCAATIPALAQDRFEIGVLGGITRFERALTRDDAEVEPTAGLRTAFILTPRLSWFVDGTYATVDTVYNGEATANVARTGVEYAFQPERDTRWFIAGGGGYMWIGFDRGDDYDNWIYSASAGQKIQLSRENRLSLRWEVRGDVSVSRGSWDQTLNDGKILVGLVWGAPVAAGPQNR